MVWNSVGAALLSSAASVYVMHRAARDALERRQRTARAAHQGAANIVDEEWLSAVIAQVWPAAAEAVEGKVLEVVNKVLANIKPKWMEELTLQKFVLGPQPPKVTDIRVPLPGDDQLRECKIEVDLEWFSQSDIEIGVRPLPAKLQLLPGFLRGAIQEFAATEAGVEELHVCATVVITMLPLLAKLPVVGALQVCLLKEPMVDFNLTLTGGELGVLNVLKPLIWRVLRGAVFPGLVYPEHICVRLNKQVPDICKPEGLLEVVIDRANDVPSEDWLGRSDAYVRAYVRSRSVHSTRVVTDKNPVWGARMHMLVHARAQQTLVLELCDSDRGGDDDIGVVEVPLADLEPCKVHELVLPVRKGRTVDGQAAEQLRSCTLAVQLLYSCATAAPVVELLQQADLTTSEGRAKARESAPPLLRNLLCSGAVKVACRKVTVPSVATLPLSCRIEHAGCEIKVGNVKPKKDALTLKFGGAATFDLLPAGDPGLREEDMDKDKLKGKGPGQCLAQGQADGQADVLVRLFSGSEATAVATFHVSVAELHTRQTQFAGVCGGELTLRDGDFALDCEAWWFGLL